MDVSSNTGNNSFPLGPESVSAELINSPSVGEYYQLNCTQNKYSFDYYAVYPPLTIFNTSGQSYITYYGFTASFDPKTSIFTNMTGSIYSSSGLLKAVYR